MTDQNKIRILFPYDNPTIIYVPTPFGRKFHEDNQILSREDRASSGMLRRDIIATKKLFTLSYASIVYSGGLELFEQMFRNHNGAVLKFELVKPNTASSVAGALITDEYKVLMSGFNAGRLTVGKQGIWEGVSVTFTEI